MNRNPTVDTLEPMRYTARQPILTANQKVIGYKLLFKTSLGSYFANANSPDVNRSIIDVSSLIGLTTLCDRRYGFIGCTRETLMEKYLTLLPPDKVVAEIVESVWPDADVQQACRDLKDSGYKIALGNFTVDDPREPLVEYADFIKVDIQKTPLEDAAGIVARYRGHNTRMLAENVATQEDFDLTRAAGFRYFQGRFFRKPEKLRARGVSSSRATCLQLLQTISRPELNWVEVEDTIKRDGALYYRLLRYMNSAIFGLSGQVRSVSHALTILGEDRFRRWCRLATVLAISQDWPSDLLRSALVRARFSELIGARVEHGDADLFLLGLMSLMDAILQIPMGKVLEGLPLDNEAETLLLEHKGPLFPIYRLLFAVESGAWRTVVRSCMALGIDEEFVAASYQDAMDWAHAMATIP